MVNAETAEIELKDQVVPEGAEHAEGQDQQQEESQDIAVRAQQETCFGTPERVGMVHRASPPMRRAAKMASMQSAASQPASTNSGHIIRVSSARGLNGE